MNMSETPKRGLPGAVRRKAVNASSQQLLHMQPLYPDRTLPLLLQPAIEGVDLIDWALHNQEMLEQKLLKHGALLFRGFAINDANDFQRLIRTVSGELLEYSERSSPRSQVSGNVYTSTDHPADQSIFLHNENSYQRVWPLHIFFYCHIPAQQGGETPLCDVRNVYAHISPRTRERFAEKGVLYVRNFGDGFGLSWQTVFQTTEKQAVEAYCQKVGLTCEWKDGERLRTRRVGQAVMRHPVTDEMLWFNHATFFHISTLEPAIRDPLVELFQEEDLPNNSYYGDGTPIEAAVMDELREAYRLETVAFPWQKGDVLMVDNMLVAHGRSPFVGTRKVLTGMTRPFQSSFVGQ